MLCPRRPPGAEMHPNLPAEDQWQVNWVPGETSPSHTEHKDGEKIVHSTKIGWLQAWPYPPETCSFCGCCRPSDVFRLCALGWEIEVTDKKYKLYLQPPGYHERMRAVMQARVEPGSGDAGAEELLKPFKDFQHPTPPVKAYMHHFTKEEIEALNRIVHSQKAGD